MRRVPARLKKRIPKDIKTLIKLLTYNDIKQNSVAQVLKYIYVRINPLFANATLQCTTCKPFEFQEAKINGNEVNEFREAYEEFTPEDEFQIKTPKLPIGLFVAYYYPQLWFYSALPIEFSLSTLNIFSNDFLLAWLYYLQNTIGPMSLIRQQKQAIYPAGIVISLVNEIQSLYTSLNMKAHDVVVEENSWLQNRYRIEDPKLIRLDEETFYQDFYLYISRYKIRYTRWAKKGSLRRAELEDNLFVMQSEWSVFATCNERNITIEDLCLVDEDVDPFEKSIMLKLSLIERILAQLKYGLVKLQSFQLVGFTPDNNNFYCETTQLIGAKQGYDYIQHLKSILYGEFFFNGCFRVLREICRAHSYEKLYYKHYNMNQALSLVCTSHLFREAIDFNFDDFIHRKKGRPRRNLDISLPRYSDIEGKMVPYTHSKALESFFDYQPYIANRERSEDQFPKKSLILHYWYPNHFHIVKDCYYIESKYIFPSKPLYDNFLWVFLYKYRYVQQNYIRAQYWLGEFDFFRFVFNFAGQGSFTAILWRGDRFFRGNCQTWYYLDESSDEENLNTLEQQQEKFEREDRGDRKPRIDEYADIELLYFYDDYVRDTVLKHPKHRHRFKNYYRLPLDKQFELNPVYDTWLYRELGSKFWQHVYNMDMP